MRTFLHLLLAFLAASAALAGTTGKIRGKITDRQTGEGLASVNVVVEGTQLGAATNYDGEYIIINIPPGNYRLRASIMGYAPLVARDVRVVVDQTTIVPLVMDQSAVEMNDIIVEAERPMVQRDLTATLNSVSSEQIKTLPVRNFVEVVQLQAGVVGDGRSINIRGGRDYEAAFLIDGMYVKNPVLGTLGTTVNNDAIEEMNLLSGTFNAEYGNAGSGVINIVTKEGGSTLRASAELRTSKVFGKPYTEYNENRASVTVSGPIESDSAAFFLSGEVDERDSWLPYGYEDVASGIAKVNGRLLPELKATITGRFSAQRRQPYNHAWKYIGEQYRRIRENSAQAILTVTHTVRPDLYYDVRLSYLYESYYSGIDKDTSQYLPVGSWEWLETAGNGFEFWKKADPVELTDNSNKVVDLKGDLLWQIGARNEVKFGIQAKTYELKYFNVYDPKRNFPYITNFTKWPLEAAVYIQDKIEMYSFVLNLGLRFDWMNQRAPYRADPYDLASVVDASPKSQISPRLGIAHPISERTSLHFSYGHFFQNHSYNVFYENPQYDFQVREPLFWNPNLDAERRVAYEVGISHQFGPTVAGTFTAFYTDITGQIGTQYYEAFSEGRPVAYTLYVNEAYGNTKGFLINLNMRRTRYVSGTLNYTFSVSRNSASSETEDYPGPSVSTLLYPSNWDRRHVLNANVSLQIPDREGPALFGGYPLENSVWNIVLRAATGRPYTPGGRDVGFVEKNSARMPGTYSLDFLGSKDWRIDPLTITLFLEVLNLTDHKNVVYVYSDTGEPDVTNVGSHSEDYVKDPSNYGPPRRIRLGVRLQY